MNDLHELRLMFSWAEENPNLQFDDSGRFTEQKKKVLEKFVKPDSIVLEIGTFMGKSARWIAERAKHIIAVDHFKGSPELQEEYKKQNYEGNFDAFTMFVDVSGFTQMTQTLMQGGDEGAEILSDILNKIFNPTVNYVYSRGGFIYVFAGDPFTFLFHPRIIILSLHVQSLS